MACLEFMRKLVLSGGKMLAVTEIAREAITLLDRVTALEDKYGELFPFLSVLGLVPPELSNMNFPNLYTLVQEHYRKFKNMTNFRFSENRLPPDTKKGAEKPGYRFHHR